jgi:hypothetical protein
MTATLNFRPEQQGYGVAHPNQLVSVKLAGGKARTRADVDGATSNVGCTWFLDAVDYLQFMDFMNTTLLRGSQPFLLDLIIDFPYPTRYLCQMVPGTFKTSTVQGLSYRVSMEVEVEQVDYFFLLTGFIFTNPNTISTPTPITFSSKFFIGQTIQLVGAAVNNGVNPRINLDSSLNVPSIYTIASFPTGSSMTLTSPATVNSDWTVLAGYPGATTGLIANTAIVGVPA